MVVVYYLFYLDHFLKDSFKLDLFTDTAAILN